MPTNWRFSGPGKSSCVAWQPAIWWVKSPIGLLPKNHAIFGFLKGPEPLIHTQTKSRFRNHVYYAYVGSNVDQYLSKPLNGLKEKSTGNHRFSHEIWSFPVKFPLKQSTGPSVWVWTVPYIGFPGVIGYAFPWELFRGRQDARWSEKVWS